MVEATRAIWLLAQAEGQAPAAPMNPMGGCLEMAPFFVIIFAIFYFMVIRPQKKQQSQQARFLEGLKAGDRVITTSGIYGRIVSIDSGVAVLDVGDRTKIRLARSHVQRFQTEDEREDRSDVKPAAAEDEAKEADKKSKSKGS